MVRTCKDWETWFRWLLEELERTSAETDTEILDHPAIAGSDLGHRVIEFRQSLRVGNTPLDSSASPRSHAS